MKRAVPRGINIALGFVACKSRETARQQEREVRTFLTGLAAFHWTHLVVVGKLTQDRNNGYIITAKISYNDSCLATGANSL